MATTFKSLHCLIRAVLGDNDSQVLLFSDDTLNSHIRLRILADNNQDVQEDGELAVFTRDLTAQQKTLLILKVSKAIIAPVPDSFSFRNAVHSVSRRGGSLQLLSWLDEQIESVESDSYMKSDTEISAFINGALRFYNNYSEAATSEL